MTESRSPLEVLNNHVEAFVAKDMDSILSDFTDDAVIILMEGSIV